MNYLLDTHVLIWSYFDYERISKKVQTILIEEQDILISSVNFWEISIKHNSGKLSLGMLKPTDLLFKCKEDGYLLIPLEHEDAASFCNLSAVYHKDPFDRMLIWQAIQNNYTLITNDDNIKSYKSEGLKTLW